MLGERRFRGCRGGESGWKGAGTARLNYNSWNMLASSEARATWVGDEIVLFDHGSDPDLGTGTAVIHADYFALAANPDTIRERDLGRQRHREFDARSLSQLGLDVEKDTV